MHHLHLAGIWQHPFQPCVVPGIPSVSMGSRLCVVDPNEHTVCVCVWQSLLDHGSICESFSSGRKIHSQCGGGGGWAMLALHHEEGQSCKR